MSLCRSADLGLSLADFNRIHSQVYGRDGWWNGGQVESADAVYACGGMTGATQSGPELPIIMRDSLGIYIAMVMVKGKVYQKCVPSSSISLYHSCYHSHSHSEVQLSPNSRNVGINCASLVRRTTKSHVKCRV